MFWLRISESKPQDDDREYQHVKPDVTAVELSLVSEYAVLQLYLIFLVPVWRAAIFLIVVTVMCHPI